MIITITESDILTCRKGKFKGGWFHCPIELAAQRAFKQPMWALGTEALVSAKDWAIYSLPSEAIQFAEMYEAGAKVEPLTFEVISAS